MIISVEGSVVGDSDTLYELAAYFRHAAEDMERWENNRAGAEGRSPNAPPREDRVSMRRDDTEIRDLKRRLDALEQEVASLKEPFRL